MYSICNMGFDLRTPEQGSKFVDFVIFRRLIHERKLVDYQLV